LKDFCANDTIPHPSTRKIAKKCERRTITNVSSYA